MTDPLLCDGGGSSLYDLKVKLTKEIANYRIAIVRHECYCDLNQQLADITRPNFRNITQEDVYYDKMTNTRLDMTYSVEKIQRLEAAIKKIDAGFKSTIDYSAYSNISFTRIGRG